MTDLPVPPKSDVSDVSPSQVASGGVPIEVKIKVGQTWRTNYGHTIYIHSTGYGLFYIQENGGYPKPRNPRFLVQWLVAQGAVLIQSPPPNLGRGPNDPVEVP